MRIDPFVAVVDGPQGPVGLKPHDGRNVIGQAHINFPPGRSQVRYLAKINRKMLRLDTTSLEAGMVVSQYGYTITPSLLIQCELTMQAVDISPHISPGHKTSSTRSVTNM